MSKSPMSVKRFWTLVEEGGTVVTTRDGRGENAETAVARAASTITRANIGDDFFICLSPKRISNRMRRRAKVG